MSTERRVSPRDKARMQEVLDKAGQEGVSLVVVSFDETNGRSSISAAGDGEGIAMLGLTLLGLVRDKTVNPRAKAIFASMVSVYEELMEVTAKVESDVESRGSDVASRKPGETVQ